MIRPSPVNRVIVVVLAVAWTWLRLRGLGAGDGVGVINVVFTVVGLVLIGSNLTLRVVGDGDVLRVRNLYREVRNDRREIDSFVMHSPGGLPPALGQGVAALLADGRLIDMRATVTGPFGAARRARHRERLQAWLRPVA